jgi:hypothetical protein
MHHLVMSHDINLLANMNTIKKQSLLFSSMELGLEVNTGKTLSLCSYIVTRMQDKILI